MSNGYATVMTESQINELSAYWDEANNIAEQPEIVLQNNVAHESSVEQGVEQSWDDALAPLSADL